MSSSARSKHRNWLVLAVLVGVAAIGWGFAKRSRSKSTAQGATTETASPVSLVPNAPNTLRLPSGMAERLGIRTVVAALGEAPRILSLNGSLALDPALLQEVRSPFAAEVAELGEFVAERRPLRFGDPVTKGQTIVVLRSLELGAKKSELVDSLLQLKLHQTTLDNLQASYRSGAIPAREYREATELVQRDRNEVESLRRTLTTWRVSDEERAAVEAEAERLIAQQESSRTTAADWARADLKSALDGVLLEQDLAVGDMIAPDDVLLKIADLTRLRVVANAYEEDLSALDALAPEQRRWSVVTPAIRQSQPFDGEIEQIGRIIDPLQHTAAVVGWVDNSSGRLRAGQFVTVNVPLPPPAAEIVLPASAIIEQGGEQLLFVQTGEGSEYQRRSVWLSRQAGNSVCLLAEPPAGAEGPGVQEESPPLRVGEVVVTSGAVELQQALVDLQATGAAPAEATSNAPAANSEPAP